MEIEFKNRKYDFDGILPVVDNCRLRSKEAIKDAIFTLLHDVGYRFDFAHPVPPILRNYRDVDSRSLVKFFKVVFNQVAFVRSDFPWNDYRLDFFGFSENNTRLCIVEYTSGGLSCSTPVPLDGCSKYVESLIQNSKGSFKIVIN